MVQQIASMENRTVNDYDLLAKLIYQKQILKKAIVSDLPCALSCSEKDNLISILGQYGLKQCWYNVLIKIEAKCKSIHK